MKEEHIPLHLIGWECIQPRHYLRVAALSDVHSLNYHLCGYCTCTVQHNWLWHPCTFL